MAPGFNFIRVGSTAEIIKISLSVYVLCLWPSFEKLFCSIKVWCKVHKIGIGRKTVHEIDPWLSFLKFKFFSEYSTSTRHSVFKLQHDPDHPLAAERHGRAGVQRLRTLLQVTRGMLHVRTWSWSTSWTATRCDSHGTCSMHADKTRHFLSTNLDGDC